MAQIRIRPVLMPPLPHHVRRKKAVMGRGVLPSKLPRNMVPGLIFLA